MPEASCGVVAATEDVLAACERPLDPARPVVYLSAGMAPPFSRVWCHSISISVEHK